MHLLLHLLTNTNDTVLFTRITNDLARRTAEHKAGSHDGFIKKYNVHKLMCFETYASIMDAITRDKQFEAGSWAKELTLINADNPNWKELAG